MLLPPWPAVVAGASSALLLIASLEAAPEGDDAGGHGPPSTMEAQGLNRADREVLGKLEGHLHADDWNALPAKRRRQLLSYAKSRFENRNPFAVCWAPGASDELVHAFHAVEEAAPFRGKPRPDRPAAATQLGARWSTTASNGSGQNVQGRPVTLTWSLVPDGTAIPSAFAGDSSDASDFRAWIVGIYGGDASLPPDDPVNAAWFSLFEDMFASYAAKTGLRYIYEPNDDGATLSSNSGILGVRGDIRIGAHEIDGTPAPGEATTLAYNYFPSNGDMVLDSADTTFNSTSQDSRLFRNTIEHEHGHGLGMEHVCPLNQTKLMEPSISYSFLGLQFDDIYSAQRHYGDPLEIHDSVRDNDSFSNASPIALSGGAPFDFQWLSIDDNDDSDYLSFNAPAGAFLTARVIPGNGSYPEGAQNSDGTCPAGTSFNSSTQHNLVLEILDPDELILASANATGAGGTEEILSAQTTKSGTHYLRVSGDSSNAAQLFRLESTLTIPGVAFTVASRFIQLESLLPPNGKIDPGETVAYQIDVTNVGAQQATNVLGTLSGPAGFTGFTPQHDYGSLAPSATTAGSFIFALSGSFGEEIALDLTLTADGSIAQVAPLSFSLGKPLLVLDEQFDTSGGALPAGWSSAGTGSASGWSVVTNDSFSPPSSLFAADVGSKGLSNLTSPQVTASGGSATLSFWHRYNTEAGFDGGVLEVSVDGGGWNDILAAGASFLEGGYDSTLAQGGQNQLPNREAWSGNSGGWLRSAVSLPGSLLDTPVRFRWRLGTDRTQGGEGWYLDDVRLETGLFETPGDPGVDLVVVDGQAAESDAGDTALVQVTTPLPLVGPLAVPLQSGGTATLGGDVTSAALPVVTIPAGQLNESVVLVAVKDTEVEGSESLTLEIDGSAPLVPGGNGPAAIVINDTLYGQWAFTNLGTGPLNGPRDDRDGDLSDNVTEYAWGTDGTSFLSRPELHARRDGALLRIDAPVATLPGDVVMTAEGSFDLFTWSADGIQMLPDGFAIPVTDESFFLRLGFTLAP